MPRKDSSHGALLDYRLDDDPEPDAEWFAGFVHRVEQGMTTAEDARMIREYVKFWQVQYLRLCAEMTDPSSVIGEIAALTSHLSDMLSAALK